MTTRSAYVSLLGRPNAGKSTLFNAILGEELSIVTPKPQTTWNRISGILTDKDTQLIFLDTPGVERKPDSFTRKLITVVKETVLDADYSVLIVDMSAKDPFGENIELMKLALDHNKPLFVVLNKMDLAGKLEKVHDTIQKFKAHLNEQRIVPVSALKKTGTNILLDKLRDACSPGPFYFPQDELSQSSTRFFVRELIRKQIFNHLNQELPWSTAVLIEGFNESEDFSEIQASIIVDRDGQKGIVIGKGAEKIKNIGTDARIEIEKLLGQKVHLDLSVKVKKGWKKKPHFLRSLGIEEGKNDARS